MNREQGEGHEFLHEATQVKKLGADAAAAEWEFHNAMLGVKEQAIAQYGKNSDQLQALDLKKKSEYKSPARKKAAA